MESIRRRHMSQFRAGNEPYRTGNPQQPAFRNSGSEQQYISGNEPYRQNTGNQAQAGYTAPVNPQQTDYTGTQPQTGYTTGTKPQSPLVAVPIIETHVGMKRPPSVHPMEFPVSADAYPDPGTF